MPAAERHMPFTLHAGRSKRRVAIAPAIGVTRGQNRSRAMPTRNQQRRRSCPPYNWLKERFVIVRFGLNYAFN
jgi:hypothetical protein